jgi:hypothetical protein
MSEAFDLLLSDAPEITVRGREPLPWWKLGSLCRYESQAHREESWLPLKVTIFLVHYEIKRVTPKGCWIEDYHGHERFVLDSARKKWAYPTEELARESFIARKEWQIHHLNRQLEHAQAALKHVSAMPTELKETA